MTKTPITEKAERECRSIDEVFDRMRSLETAAHGLRDALDRLGEHDPDCHMSKRARCAGCPPTGHPLHEEKCDCGLWEALARFDALKEAK